ncbi:MAG: hypothetical protein M1840_001777 [Geoglossum simile]|nr:MAG: hypothetical protein M1840_001777 [Geoglossum simile]
MGFKMLPIRTHSGAFRFIEAIAWTSIFPYVYFMIETFPEVAEPDISFYAGLLVAVFTFSEFLSAMIWAKISDRIGRKLVLLIGILAGVVSAVAFGFSKSIVGAVVSRAIGGLMNPNVGVVQTCIGELAKDKKQQAKAFPIVSSLRGIGSLIGPALGGLLADPVKHYSSVFRHDSVWEYYPYLLPNLVVAFLSVLGMLPAFLFLRETHPRLARNPDFGLKVGNWITSALGERINRKYFHYSRLQDDSVVEVPSRRRSEVEDGNATALELQPLQSDSSPDGLGDGESLHSDSSPDDLDDGKSLHMPPKPFTLQVVLQILSVSLLAFHKVSADIIIPTFLAFPREPLRDSSPRLSRDVLRFSGGFGLSTQEIGSILLTQAGIAIVAQATLIPFALGRYGALKIFRLVLCTFPVMYLFTPFVVRLAPPLAITAILLDLWVKVLLSSTGYVCSAIL